MQVLPKLLLITNGETIEEHLQCAQLAVECNIPWIQIRFKHNWTAQSIRLVKEIVKLCDQHSILCTINDDIDLAKSLNIKSVHLGLQDAHPKIARKELQQPSIIGSTANTFSDIQSRHKDVDYFGVGPFRITQTKKQLSPILGLAGYTSILQNCAQYSIQKPILAIGGIQPSDVRPLLDIGIHGVAISSSILQHKNPSAQAERFLKALT